MQSLKFNQLLLLSNPSKSANRFDFQSRVTVITADDNNYGKSTLAKMLLWTLGCEPAFDSQWKGLDCKAILKFSIGDKKFETMRYKDIICLNENGTIKIYPKVTGDYASRIAELFHFHALLPKRESNILETPPPAYYFVPYYIDQKKSWSIAWDNFEGLTQYRNWKSSIIKSHIGLWPKAHFDLEKEKYDQKQQEQIVNTEIEKIDTTLEIVGAFIPQMAATIDQKKLQVMTKEIREDLKKLSEFQEKTLDDLVKVESDKAFLFHQKSISNKIISELDKDYQYVVEHFVEDNIECPLCGTHHENSIVNRASILTDKQQAQNQLQEIENSINLVETKIEKLKDQIDKTRSDIEVIHKKYSINEGETTISLNDIIERVAGVAIKDNVQKSKSKKLLVRDTIKEEIKRIAIEQKGVLSDQQRDAIQNAFTTIFTSYIEALNAEDINASFIKTPMDYAKVVKEGGAAEGTRGILAYYITIFSLIASFGEEVVAPLIIDTPNQQEQSPDNYDKILEVITRKIPTNSQIILCALKNQKLDAIKEDAHVINLEVDKILSPKNFDEILKEFEVYKIQDILAANEKEQGTEDSNNEMIE
ncbi:hypothetical protein JMG10_07805 [Nostoc ellipsosporum NOK]|nr:hypothetical protein [Nostoc ellipsosporum NOK]